MDAVHGEYKAPGGKLVVVDLDVRDSQLADVRVSGDFFLEPSDALERIDGALTGLPAIADHDEIRARVEAALVPGTLLAGFSPAAVAVAVRRALTRASSWSDYRWELIREQPETPAMHVALDDVLVREVAAGHRPPTLRFWAWPVSAVVIGTFQSLRNEVDADVARELDVTIVRRTTGGGAMFAEPGRAVTYSVYAPAALVAGMSYAESYPFLDAWVVRALKERLGLAASYRPLNDIASGEGKIGGAAQTRLADGTVLHHAMMAYDIDTAKMARVLRVGKEKLSDKGVASVEKRVSPVRRLTDLPRQQVIEAMIAEFGAQCRLVDGSVREEERRMAEQLADTKFASPEWTARVP